MRHSVCIALASALATGAMAQSGHPFVDAARIVPGLAIEMRYAGVHNFLGRPIAGYEAPRCLLTMQAAQALRRAQGLLSSTLANDAAFGGV